MDSQFIVEYAELAKRLNVTETARYLNMSQLLVELANAKLSRIRCV